MEIAMWKRLIEKSFSDFFKDQVPRLGAALAFYAAFSVPPLLMLSVGVASFFFGAEAAQGELKHELIAILGNDVAEGVQAMLAAAQKAHRSGLLSSIVGVAALLFGAMGVFVELKSSMNLIWGVEVRPELGIWGSIRDSALSFMMVVFISLLSIVSMVLTTLISTIGRSIELSSSVQWTDFVVSSTVTTLLFAMTFKWLPDVRVNWKDVWIGAGVTALLFTVGKYLVGLYLANAQIRTAYGAASSVLVLLLWMYYSSQIFFLGAEFTQVQARMHGRGIQPSINARFTSYESRRLTRAKAS